MLLGVGHIHQEKFSLKTVTTTLQASKIDVKQKFTNPGISLHWKHQKVFFFYRHYLNVTLHKGSQTLYFVALKSASDCMKTLNQNML